MRITRLYRYVLTGEVRGKSLQKFIRTAPFRQFRWMRYKLFSYDEQSEIYIWRLDGRSVSRLEGIEIIENKPEEAELWTT
jgi:hypothetical protein